MMAKKKGKKGENSSLKKKAESYGPSFGAGSYTGPVVSKLRLRDEQCSTALISNASTVTILSTTNTLGVSYGSGAVSGFNDFADFAAVWDAYRVLAMEVIFLVDNTNSAAINTVMVAVCDYDDSGTLSSILSGSSYDSAEFFNFPGSSSVTTPSKALKYAKWRANSPDLMQFSTTAGAPTKTGAIKTFWSTTANVNANTNIALVIHRALVQFRGRD